MEQFKLIIVEDVPLELKGTEGILRNDVPEAEITAAEQAEGQQIPRRQTGPQKPDTHTTPHRVKSQSGEAQHGIENDVHPVDVHIVGAQAAPDAGDEKQEQQHGPVAGFQPFQKPHQPGKSEGQGE